LKLRINCVIAQTWSSLLLLPLAQALGYLDLEDLLQGLKARMQSRFMIELAINIDIGASLQTLIAWVLHSIFKFVTLHEHCPTGVT
jgi:hypothetical protein